MNNFGAAKWPNIEKVRGLRDPREGGGGVSNLVKSLNKQKGTVPVSVPEKKVPAVLVLHLSTVCIQGAL